MTKASLPVVFLLPLQSYLPLDLRPKKTRALRQALSKEQVRRRTFLQGGLGGGGGRGDLGFEGPLGAYLGKRWGAC